jgi:NAD(P)-dependent dehydrogenase (short-subunit alcohol dehydrogenase family)
MSNILITGASSGIGKSCSLELDVNGNKLNLCGRTMDKLTHLKVNIKNAETEIYCGNINDDGYLTQLTDSIEPLDGIVLSSGIVKTLPVKNLTRASLSETFETNTISPIVLVSMLLKKKKIKKNGAIIFISSIGGPRIGDKGNGAYAASKSALTGFTKVLAVELSKFKIRANCILPGMVNTPMTRGSLASISSNQLDLNENLYPLGYGEPENIAKLIKFLLSEESEWITGSEIVIDGGFSIT